MTRAAIYAGLDRLAARFAVKLSGHMMRRYRVTFEDLPLEVWEEGIANAIDHAKEFPEPSDFHQFLPPPAWSKAKNGGEADPDHARNALRLIHQLMAGRLSREERAEAFDIMARVYPGIGWERAAEEARQPPPRSTAYHATHVSLGITADRCDHCQKQPPPKAA